MFTYSPPHPPPLQYLACFCIGRATSGLSDICKKSKIQLPSLSTAYSDDQSQKHLYKNEHLIMMILLASDAVPDHNPAVICSHHEPDWFSQLTIWHFSRSTIWSFDNLILMIYKYHLPSSSTVRYPGFFSRPNSAWSRSIVYLVVRKKSSAVTNVDRLPHFTVVCVIGMYPSDNEQN